jgi:drug/metabolite transporter superfamily protein YnfA
MEDRTDLRLDDEGDAKITAMLRDVYAPPAEGAYWDGLETRIMAYIKAHDVASIPVNWWSDLASWAGPGLAAAALVFVAAGLMWSRQKDEELRTTYDAVTEPLASDVLPGAVQVVTAPYDGSSQREATFRYVLSH